MDEHVEFYITCNPPLLPKGVQHIIKEARALINKGHLAEILYEPDVPWFKCISLLSYQETVTQALQGWLLQILKEETRVVSTGAVNLIDVVDDAAQADVGIIAEDPRLMAWSTYKSQGDDFIESFNEHRFPETMLGLKHKVIWRGIEDWAGGTFENLLSTFRRFFKIDNAPGSVDDLRCLVNCQAISYNLKEDLVYLGTDESTEVLDHAVRTLENLLSFVILDPRPVSHLLVLERRDDIRVIYKWLSHIGLSRITYVQAGNSSLHDEYRLLLGAATLRTETRIESKRWLPDKMVYPNQAAPELCSYKSFEPFVDYIFRGKKAGEQPREDGQLAATSPETSLGVISEVAMTDSVASSTYAGKRIPAQCFDESSKLPPVVKDFISHWLQDVDTPFALSNGKRTDSSEGKKDSPQTIFREEMEDLISFDAEPSAQIEAEQKMVGGDRDGPVRMQQESDISPCRKPDDDPPDETSDDLICFGIEAETGISQDSSGGHAQDDLLATSPVKGQPRSKSQEKLANPSSLAKIEEKWPALRVATPSPRKRSVVPQSRNGQLNPSLKNGDDATEMSPNRHLLQVPASENGKTLFEELRQQISVQAESLARVLQLMPGDISLSLAFGRIYLKQFSPSQVYSEAGPSFEVEDTVSFLNASDFRQELVGFSPILTTVAEEANKIPLTRADSPWHLFGKQTWYDFVCVLDDDDEDDDDEHRKRFVVEVDADSCEHDIRQPRQGVYAIYLHCPRRAWDMRVCATRRNCLEGEPRYKAFAKLLVASMAVSVQKAGIAINTPGAEVLGGRVESVQISQTATYQDNGSSELAITMITTMEAAPPRRNADIAPAKGQNWVRRRGTGTGNGAIPCQWFEASITSSRVTELFEANKGLEFGQSAAWSKDAVEFEEVLDDMCRPALEMMRDLDGIGCTNNNKQRLDARDAFHDGAVARRVSKEQQYVFW